MNRAIIVLLALAGCASPASIKSPLLTSGSALPGDQVCLVDPGPPAAVDQWVDSAGLATRIADLPSTQAGDYVVFSMLSDSTGTIEDIWVVEGNLTDAATEQIQGAITQAARAQVPGDRQSTLLRLDLGVPVQLRTGNSVECPPVMRNRPEVDRILQEGSVDLVRKHRLLAGRKYTAMVMLLADTAGNVQAVELNESSGQTAIDELALEVAREWEFYPARINRRAVSVWLQVPINIRLGPASD